jgi:hypothetical protein
MIQLIKNLDLGINKIQVKEEVFFVDYFRDIPKHIKKLFIESGIDQAASIGISHRKFDADGNYHSIEKFDLEEDESEGTKKVFALSGLLTSALKARDCRGLLEFPS